MIKKLLYGGILGFLLSCGDSDSNAEDPIVASVGNKHLYQSELAEFFPANANGKDSQNVITNFVDNWIRENIVLQEAEKYIASEIDIDQLVKDYRASLLIYNYEERLVKERLDTFISDLQKNQVYEANKNSYLLTTPIMKGFSIAIPVTTPELDGFKKDWIKQDLVALQAYCQKYQLDCKLFPNTWVTFAEFFSEVPEKVFTLSKLKNKKAQDKEYDGVQYFVKLEEFRDKNEVAPLDYIEDKIEKVILYNRKVTLLKTIKQKLYERDLENKKVKIYDENL